MLKLFILSCAFAVKLSHDENNRQFTLQDPTVDPKLAKDALKDPKPDPKLPKEPKLSKNDVASSTVPSAPVLTPIPTPAAATLTPVVIANKAVTATPIVAAPTASAPIVFPAAPAAATSTTKPSAG